MLACEYHFSLINAANTESRMADIVTGTFIMHAHFKVQVELVDVVVSHRPD